MSTVFTLECPGVTALNLSYIEKRDERYLMLHRNFFWTKRVYIAKGAKNLELGPFSKDVLSVSGFDRDGPEIIDDRFYATNDSEKIIYKYFRYSVDTDFAIFKTWPEIRSVEVRNRSPIDISNFTFENGPRIKFALVYLSDVGFYRIFIDCNKQFAVVDVLDKLLTQMARSPASHTDPLAIYERSLRKILAKNNFKGNPISIPGTDFPFDCIYEVVDRKSELPLSQNKEIET